MAIMGGRCSVCILFSFALVASLCSRIYACIRLCRMFTSSLWYSSRHRCYSSKETLGIYTHECDRWCFDEPIWIPKTVPKLIPNRFESAAKHPNNGAMHVECFNCQRSAILGAKIRNCQESMQLFWNWRWGGDIRKKKLHSLIGGRCVHVISRSHFLWMCLEIK